MFDISINKFQNSHKTSHSDNYPDKNAKAR